MLLASCIFKHMVGQIWKFFSQKPSALEGNHSSKFQGTNEQTHWYPFALEDRYLNWILTCKLFFSLIETKLLVYLTIFLSINLSLHHIFHISIYLVCIEFITMASLFYLKRKERSKARQGMNQKVVYYVQYVCK